MIQTSSRRRRPSSGPRAAPIDDGDVIEVRQVFEMEDFAAGRRRTRAANERAEQTA